MEEHQRDQSVDRLLRQSFAVHDTGEVSGECVDPEKLATWMDSALPAAEAAGIDRHVADCERCQMLLATFVRTEPPSSPEPWWQRWRVRWLVPAATAATVAALWLAIPPGDRAAPEPTPAPQRAEQRQRFAPPSDSATGAIDDVPPAASQAGRGATQDRALPRSKAEAEAQQEPAPGAVGERVVDRQASAPQPAPPPAVPLESVPQPQTPAAAAPAAPSDKRAEERITVFAESVAPGAMEIDSPGAAVRWRILSDGSLERLATGANWAPVALPQPTRLSAGHSPAPFVAWFVGRGGAIFVTPDGSTFRRVPFIEPADLVAVTAVNDREASVTAADGRVFRTADGGATWIRNPRD